MQFHIQSQQNPENTFYKQDIIRFKAPPYIQKVFACLQARKDSHYRTKITNNQIQEWTGLSKSSVQRATRWLEQNGYYHKQYWISAPCYNAPTVFILEDEFRTEEWQYFLTRFFKNFCKLAIMLLMSIPAAGEDDVPLVLKRNYGIDIELVRRAKEPVTFRSLFKQGQQVAQDQWASLAFGFVPIGIGEPDQQVKPKNKPRTGEVMQAELFTHDQLVELTKYPEDILKHAIATLAKKSVDNPFTWVRKVCELELSKRSDNDSQPSFSHSYKKSPTMGKSRASIGKPRPSTFTEHVSGSKWIPGARIINPQRGFQTDVTYVETDLEFALNYERLIHQRTIDNPTFAAQCSRFDRNPLWHKLSPQEQTIIWEQAHPSPCTCRKNQDAGLLMPEVAAKLQHKTEEPQGHYDPSLFEEVF